MLYFVIEPMVPGFPGEETKWDNPSDPETPVSLHMDCNVWPTDDLVEGLGNYLVSPSVREELEVIAATGCEFDTVLLTIDSQIEELHPGQPIPEYFWLKVHGVTGVDDFGISTQKMLVVSDRILDLLSHHNIERAEIGPFNE